MKYLGSNLLKAIQACNEMANQDTKDPKTKTKHSQEATKKRKDEKEKETPIEKDKTKQTKKDKASRPAKAQKVSK